MVSDKKTISKRFIAYTIFLLALSILSLVLDHQGYLSKPRHYIQLTVTTPIKEIADWPGNSINYFDIFFTKQTSLIRENQEKDKEIAWLKASLADKTVLEAENRRLKLLFESTATHTRPVSIAEVVDSYIDSTRHEIEINKGSEHGTFVGQIVIDENGVLGQIIKNTQNTSTVALITDTRQRIPVFIERNRTRMIARGVGYLDELEMSFAALDADIRVGDKLVTSGLGGRFPRGYQIGEVTSVEKNPANQFTIVKAKPYAALDRVLEVLLINTQNNSSEDSTDNQTNSAQQPLTEDNQ